MRFFGLTIIIIQLMGYFCERKKLAWTNLVPEKNYVRQNPDMDAIRAVP
jgi:hypothetical protein